jgi:hypothetical protein
MKFEYALPHGQATALMQKGNPDRLTVGVAFLYALTGPIDRKRSVALPKQAGETYTFITFSACGPFGPCVTSNSTS